MRVSLPLTWIRARTAFQSSVSPHQPASLLLCRASCKAASKAFAVREFGWCRSTVV